MIIILNRYIPELHSTAMSCSWVHVFSPQILSMKQSPIDVSVPRQADLLIHIVPVTEYPSVIPIKVEIALSYPNCRQITFASSRSQYSLHTVPHVLLYITWIRPLVWDELGSSLTVTTG